MRPSRIRIDTDALIHNLNQVRLYAPHSLIMAMVKANAYGCGIDIIAPKLDGQVHRLGVASLDEAYELTKLGISTPAVLMEGVFSASEYHDAAWLNCDVIIHQDQQVNWLLSSTLKRPLTVWIKVNTGMNRLGFSPDEAKMAYLKLKNAPQVAHIHLMSHFACADTPEHPMNQNQLAMFNALDDIPVTQKSMANSAAIITNPRSHFDVVRPGIMLYGASPLENILANDLDLKPVMHFTTQICDIRDLNAGSTIGYGADFTLHKKATIALLPVGYGDGYPRHVKDAKVSINGMPAPVVGRVSMDMMTVDITHIDHATIGSPVTLWGDDMPIDTVAKASNTSSYELLCQITNRVRGFSDNTSYSLKL